MMDALFTQDVNGGIDPNLYLISNLDQQPDPSKFIFFANGRRIGSAGNFVVITGKPKARKSAFAQAILSSAITGAEIMGMGIRMPVDYNQIVLVDTEQDLNDIAANLYRLKKQCGIKSFKAVDNLGVYSVSELEPEKLISFINTLFITRKGIGLMIIDGLLDLINDMNDVKESRNLLHQIKLWAKNHNCLIITILHQSKSTGYSIGHLGSFADRKAQAVLSVEKEKDENISTLSAQYMRSDKHFNPISIIYNAHSEAYEMI
jgi:RecA-family ATPase